LADECIDVQLVFRLRRLGYEVETVRAFCQSKFGDGIEDAAVLRLAREHRLALLTGNESDFVRLHGEQPGHYGILIVENEVDVSVQSKRVDAALKEAGDVRGRLVWLTRAATTPPKPELRKKRGG
jgi:hypothetical protein